MTMPHYMTKRDGNFKFALMMSAFIFLAVLVQGTQFRQDGVLDQQILQNRQIADSQKQIASTLTLVFRTQDIICNNQNSSTSKHNDLVNIGIKGVQDSTAMTPAEKVARIQLFTDSLATPVACPPLAK